jgi:glycosyltransferase involved in cell wall biosynthesis
VRLAKKKVCIISLAAYPLLSGKGNAIRVIGGAELQCVLLARELAKGDFNVSFVVCDFGQQTKETIDDITVIKAYPIDAPQGIRFSTLRLVWRALDQANAEIYYGFRGIAGIVALYCMLKGKKLVIGIPHDMDVQSKPIAKRNLYDWLWRFDMKRADSIVAQTEYQHEMISKNYGRNSVIIRAFHPIEYKEIEKDMPPIVMWAARIGPEWKQPEVFLRLARAIPDAKFWMIGGPSEGDSLYRKMEAQARAITNLHFMGFVPHDKIGEYFEKASIFVNTSTAEGFSNTFLEAWSRYTPVVSLDVDPGEIICEHKLGMHSRTFEQMVEDVKMLLHDDRLRQKLGENGRRYVEREHDLKQVVRQYAELFTGLID